MKIEEEAIKAVLSIIKESGLNTKNTALGLNVVNGSLGISFIKDPVGNIVEFGELKILVDPDVYDSDIEISYGKHKNGYGLFFKI